MALATETTPIGLYASCDHQGCKTMAYSPYYDRYEEDIDLTDMRSLNERAQHAHHEAIEGFKEQGWEFARGQWACPHHAVLERNRKAFQEEAKQHIVQLSSTLVRPAPHSNVRRPGDMPRPVPVINLLEGTTP